MKTLLLTVLLAHTEFSTPEWEAESRCISRCFNGVEVCEEECRVTEPVNPEERSCLDTCVQTMIGCVNVCWDEKDRAP